MASDLLIKRLLKQAGVSVLAGLLLSTAVLAEDNAADAGGVSVDAGGPDVSIDPAPDVSIDPVDPGLDTGGDDSVDWSGDDDGSTDGTDDGSGDDGTDDGTVDWSGEDDATDGTDDGTVDWSGEDDATDGTDDGTVDWSGEDDCMACNTIDFEVTLDGGPVRGTQPNERNLDDVGITSVPGEPVAMSGDFGAGPSGGHDVSHDFGSDAGRGAGRDGDLGAERLRIVK